MAGGAGDRVCFTTAIEGIDVKVRGLVIEREGELAAVVIPLGALGPRVG